LNYLDLNFVYHVLLQADQRLTEWRSAFGTAALTALHGFFAEQGMDTDEARQGYARTALSSQVFLYSQVFMKDGKVRREPLRWNDPQLYQLKRKGIFCGLLVVQTLAAHFRWTSNAEVVPAIGDFGRPFVAVALAAAGVSVL
jgi:hypothetical protein